MSATEIARLLRRAPFGAETWRIVDALPESIRSSYWKEVTPISLLRRDADNANRVVDELLRVERPRAAFSMVQMVFPTITSERLTRLLVEAATNRSEPVGHYPITTHYISDAFNELSKRSDVAREELARLEFLYIDALEHS